MGHSQGGQAAWAAAERQVQRPVDGYLGTIAGSPLNDAEAQLKLVPSLAVLIANYLAAGLDAAFPDFSPSDFLTEAGVRCLGLFRKLQGCNNVGTVLLAQPDAIRPDFLNSSQFRSFNNLARTGGKPVAGPLLVLQGTMDSLVPAELPSKAVDETCSRYPDSQLEYVLMNGTDHVATLPFRPQSAYQANGNYYLEYANQPYQVA
ncbi:Putative lipase, secreted, alpha/Beta hydrolase [Septoria linicola]|uniref:Lipase, secreted, alpha/Beta hydrolase n=1 Tax=Septoria linicola TaxID=215465 RepID=A0A9Q9EPV6_9PEZI|nr:putative lipase, secreted, alpha/Beta hydrolase [Septoria linicola]USW56913.1 Putative lipase, secreted, alpha/Beta hydrolase [Septoria linicola]